MTEPEPLICDTARMVALTARRPETIRHLCRHLRAPDGYDYEQCKLLLDAEPLEVIAVTAAEAEQWLGITADRVYQWVHRGQIKAFDREGRAARFRVDEMERLRNREARKAQLDL